MANNTKLAVLLKSDGIYISAFYKGFEQLNLRKLNKKIIGSAHNFQEINEKRKQINQIFSNMKVCSGRLPAPHYRKQHRHQFHL